MRDEARDRLVGRATLARVVVLAAFSSALLVALWGVNRYADAEGGGVQGRGGGEGVREELAGGLQGFRGESDPFPQGNAEESWDSSAGRGMGGGKGRGEGAEGAEGGEGREEGGGEGAEGGGEGAEGGEGREEGGGEGAEGGEGREKGGREGGSGVWREKGGPEGADGDGVGLEQEVGKEGGGGREGGGGGEEGGRQEDEGGKKEEGERGRVGGKEEELGKEEEAENEESGGGTETKEVGKGAGSGGKTGSERYNSGRWQGKSSGRGGDGLGEEGRGRDENQENGDWEGKVESTEERAQQKGGKRGGGSERRREGAEDEDWRRWEAGTGERAQDEVGRESFDTQRGASEKWRGRMEDRGESDYPYTEEEGRKDGERQRWEGGASEREHDEVGRESLGRTRRNSAGGRGRMEDRGESDYPYQDDEGRNPTEEVGMRTGSWGNRGRGGSGWRNEDYTEREEGAQEEGEVRMRQRGAQDRSRKELWRPAEAEETANHKNRKVASGRFYRNSRWDDPEQTEADGEERYKEGGYGRRSWGGRRKPEQEERGQDMGYGSFVERSKHSRNGEDEKFYAKEQWPEKRYSKSTERESSAAEEADEVLGDRYKSKGWGRENAKDEWEDERDQGGRHASRSWKSGYVRERPREDEPAAEEEVQGGSDRNLGRRERGSIHQGDVAEEAESESLHGRKHGSKGVGTWHEIGEAVVERGQRGSPESKGWRRVEADGSGKGVEDVDGGSDERHANGSWKGQETKEHEESKNTSEGERGRGENVESEGWKSQEGENKTEALPSSHSSSSPANESSTEESEVPSKSEQEESLVNSKDRIGGGGSNEGLNQTKSEVSGNQEGSVQAENGVNGEKGEMEGKGEPGDKGETVEEGETEGRGETEGTGKLEHNEKEDSPGLQEKSNATEAAAEQQRERELPSTQLIVREKGDVGSSPTGAWILGKGYRYWLDVRLARSLAVFFAGKTVLDLGAGTGHYSKIIAEKAKQVDPYDGVSNIANLTNGYVKHIDLTEPQELGVHDWVLCLEVGSHIPPKYEAPFLANIHNHNKEGVVISWAVDGQKGKHQYNTHSNTFVKELMAALGYKNDVETEQRLRRHAVLKWFKKTLMVFRK